MPRFVDRAAARCSPVESIDEVAFLLGHRDANVTRAVYLRELTDARRRAMRRSRIVAEFGELLRRGADHDDT